MERMTAERDRVRFVELRSELRDLRDGFPVLVKAGLALLAAIIGLLVWLIVSRAQPDAGAVDQSKPVELGGGPAAVSESQLAALSRTMQQPIYWAGTRPGTLLEATVMRNRQVYVRYLTTGTPIGDPSPDYLSIRNFPIPDAARALRAYAARHGLRSRSIRGSVVVPLSDSSIYLAARGSGVQAEIYSPNAGAARSLVVSGAVRPVTDVLASPRTVVSP